MGADRAKRTMERWQLILGMTYTVRRVSNQHLARIEVQGRPSTFATICQNSRGRQPSAQ
jgi:hypothetical protein